MCKEWIKTTFKLCPEPEDTDAAQPDRIAMRMKDYGIWHDITWTQYYQNVKRVAMGLHSLGVKRGDHVAIVGENKPEWLFSAMGVMSLGGIFVGVYTTNPIAECEYIVGHSESVVFFCEDEEQFDKALRFAIGRRISKNVWSGTWRGSGISTTRC